MRRLITATLWLYPRAIRRRHGAELEDLVEEMITRDGASRPVVMTRLAADGLIQRLSSAATVWVVVVTLVTTSVAGLAVSDFAAASAHQRAPMRVTSHPTAARAHLGQTRTRHIAHRREPATIEP